MTETTMVSPSRTYVIRLNKHNFEGYFFKKFTLPNDELIRNDNHFATWWFYNRIDYHSCGDTAFPFEDYKELIEVEAL